MKETNGQQPIRKAGFRIWMKMVNNGRVPFRTGGSSGGMSGSGGGSSGGGGGSAGSQGKEEGGKANPILLFWIRYNQLLASRPLLTKALTSFIGFSIGDILAQKFLSPVGSEFQMDRLLRMALFGLLIHGPTGHIFYSNLDKLIPGTEAWKVASKVAIDQLLWAPIFAVIFFGFLGISEGQSFQQIKAKIRQDWKTALLASWKVWPLAHAINFRFIPSNQRLLYINGVQIFYNVFLSIIGNRRLATNPSGGLNKK
eukprot:jgi/Galph1/5135/GphlegSOOS_G3736.1